MLRMSCFLLAILTALAGCATLEPPYKRPAAPGPDHLAERSGLPRSRPRQPAGAAVAGDPVEGVFHRPAASEGHRPGPGEQPRPAHRPSRHRALPRPVPHPALGPVPQGGRRSLRQRPEGTRGISPASTEAIPSTSTAWASASPPTNSTSSAGCAASRTRPWSSISPPRRPSAPSGSPWCRRSQPTT